MLFQSSVALLLIFSFASIQAQPEPGSPDAKAYAQPDPKTTPSSYGAQLQKVIDCINKELDKPVIPLEGPGIKDEHTPAAIAFDKCFDDIFLTPNNSKGQEAAPVTGSGDASIAQI